MKIVAVGPLWRGSNAGGLFRAISRKGVPIEVLDEFYHISLNGRSKQAKIAGRLMRGLQTKEFNEAIQEKIKLLQPDVLFVYKGAFVLPETLHFARAHKCRLVLFYPDVSTTTHGPHIPMAMPHYDLVFTTKTFAKKDLSEKYGVKNMIFVPHGFDPELHRPLEISQQDRKNFGCDISFIGTWSAKKEALLSYIKEQCPDAVLKIWGGQWSRAGNAAIKNSIQHTEVLGDMYAIAIQCSKINLGILSERVTGASSGDLITSRTFHIPGASGFMLHERNEESVMYFKENEEAGFFSGQEELVTQVKNFLQNNEWRERIRLNGHQRALRDHSLDNRATTVLEGMSQLK